MKARVTVTLKSGILDPQGKAIEGALKSLGVGGVASVRQGKVFDIEIEGGDRATAEAALKNAAEKLLANTVIENYSVTVDAEKASILLEGQHERYFLELMMSDYGTVRDAQKSPPKAGVYTFFDADKPVYVGRTNKRGLGPRMQNHLSKNQNQAVLAFKIARKELGLTTAYSGEGTRENLMKNEQFLAAFERQREFIGKLRVKFVEISDPDEQFIFEYYASKKLNSPNNDFDTH
jgi:phosphoribosylformylglycinamidine synthase